MCGRAGLERRARGLLIHALPLSLIATLLLAAAGFALVLDMVKSVLFARLRGRSWRAPLGRHSYPAFLTD
jgi:hypothetical protein